MALNLDVPNALFLRPHLEATLTIPDSAVSRPEIAVETVDNIRQAIEVGSGMTVTLRVAEPETP